MWKKLDKNGRIPSYTECPFRGQCEIGESVGPGAGQCHHYGKDHCFEFSCASARAFDLLFKDAGKKCVKCGATLVCTGLDQLCFACQMNRSRISGIEKNI